MKHKIFIIGVFAAIGFFAANKISAQVSHFDTVNVVVSSAGYDYTKPVFTVPLSGGMGSPNILIYEVHSGNISALAWKTADFAGYTAESFIVNDGYMNINAAAEGNMVVWQSNKNGGWDLYYSLWNGSVWSAPAFADSSVSDETSPCIYYSSYYTPTYYIVFERGNDVWFKYYRFNAWQGDTNLTNPINNKCYSPVFYGMNIYYLQETGTNFNTLTKQAFGITYPTYQFVWYPVDSLPKQNTVRNIHTSGEFHFEYDTLGGTDSYMIVNHYAKTYKNMTLGFSGKKVNCMGTTLAVPVSQNLLNDFWPYSVFAFQRKTADSNMIAAQSRTDNGIFTTKYFALGDTSENSRIAVSEPVRNGWTLYKMRVVWEKKINGRSALVETFDTELITGINNVSGAVPEGYRLEQNYPNPFNASTVVSFSLPVVSLSTLKVFDITGKEVATLVNGSLAPGKYEVDFDGTGLNSGVYFYRLTANNFSDTKRMLYVK